MTNGLQPNPTKGQKELINKAPVEINDHLETSLKLLLGIVNRLTLRQMPRIALPKKILQNSAMDRRGDYMAGTPFLLIICKMSN